MELRETLLSSNHLVAPCIIRVTTKIDRFKTAVNVVISNQCAQARPSSGCFHCRRQGAAMIKPEMPTDRKRSRA